jgi:succinate dehydrogenase/fumarate reductase flavoprotein subunit
MQRHSPSRPCRLGDVPAWDFEADVVVVGFGAAGASAALEAATTGATVTLFEVASGSGGTSAMAGGDIYLGGSGGTPAQRANGFEDRTEDFFRYMLLAGGPDADEARVRPLPTRLITTAGSGRSPTDDLPAQAAGSVTGDA